LEKQRISKKALITVVAASAILLAIIISVVVNFADGRNVAPERIFLKSGDIVIAEQSRTYRIFQESEGHLGWVDSYGFIFINIDDGSRVYSQGLPRSMIGGRRSYDNLIEQNPDGTHRVVSGIHIADVYLQAGNYIVELPPLPTGNYIVWDLNTRNFGGFTAVMLVCVVFFIWVFAIMAAIWILAKFMQMIVHKIRKQ